MEKVDGTNVDKTMLIFFMDPDNLASKYSGHFVILKMDAQRV
jgi:hypothetical protein